LRTPVGFADPEQYRIHEREGVREHKILDLAIVGSPPISAREKRPADFDLPFCRIVVVIAARTDDAAAGALDDTKGRAAGKGQISGSDAAANIPSQSVESTGRTITRCPANVG
jgi:hypothetical protein